MLRDLSGVTKVFLLTHYIDTPKSIDGLMAINRNTYETPPYINAVVLFYGRSTQKHKAPYFDKTGFVLLYRRLGNGRFQ